LIGAIRAQINKRLPKRYIANTELYIWREDPSDESPAIAGADTYVAEQPNSPQPSSGTAAATLLPPVTTVLRRVERKQRTIRIVDSEERRIVTVVEVLSLGK
jgi:hypothetical protein